MGKGIHDDVLHWPDTVRTRNPGSFFWQGLPKRLRIPIVAGSDQIDCTAGSEGNGT